MSVIEMRARLEQHIDRLPVLPTVVARLMVLDREEEGYFEEVLGLIEADPTVAARILAAANAAASSPRDPVASVRVALARLGSQGAARAVMDAAVSRVFVPRNDWEKSLWRHALQVGGALRALADLDPSGSVDRDVAYAAGLLHDVGRLVMFQAAPEALRRIDEGGLDSPQDLVDAERRLCGITHAELGARACRSWGLPEVLVDTVARHHHPVGTAKGPVELLIAMCRFADLAMFPSAMPGAPGMADDDEKIEQILLPRLPPNLAAVDLATLRTIIGDTVVAADATGAMLGVG